MGIVRKKNVTFINAKMAEPAEFVIKKNKEVVDSFGSFNGMLTSIAFQESNKEKGTFDGIKLSFFDDGMDYVINLGISTTVAMLLSSMSELKGEEFEKIGLSLSTYNGFPSLSAFAENGSNKPLRWNHDVKEVAAKVVVVKDASGNDIMNGKYPVKDNSELIKFIKELVEKINKNISGERDVVAEITAAEAQALSDGKPHETPVKQQEDVAEDMPF